MGGWRGIVGYPDLPPARMGVSIGDTLAATYGCMGALAALHHRDKTGEGQIVDSALYESVLQVMESLIPEHAVAGYQRTRTGSTFPSAASALPNPATRPSRPASLSTRRVRYGSAAPEIGRGSGRRRG